MLRITVHDSPQSLIIRLEGRLAGPWVRELETCWQSTQARRSNRTLRVDLTWLMFIDAAGRAVLAAMHHEGAELVAGDCMTKAIVAEITRPGSNLGVQP